MSELINNSEERVRLLKSVILGLHRGEEPAAVKAKMEELVEQASASEIAAMEQQLMDEGMPSEEIEALCDLHKEVVGSIVTPQPLGRLVPAGHPVDVFREENRALADAAEKLRDTLAAGVELEAWRAAAEPLVEVDKHYARKENLLFPKLEAYGASGPSKVMWAKDDEVRALAAAFREALAADESDEEAWRLIAESVGQPLVESVLAMIDREEKILLPMALDKLSERDWAAIHAESPRFGFCLVEPRATWTPKVSADEQAAPAPEALSSGRVALGVGSLSIAQLQGMLAVLPVDLTFVDADDRVAFFSEGERIFARTPAVIGRKVQLCHPPKSVDTVERILADFKAGRQDRAEFWIELRGVFVHIRYFAVRDEQGSYLGTLEVTQDLTRLRALSGERRLLSYDAPSEGGAS